MKLDNGLQVWLKSRPGSDSVSIVAAVKVGHRYETLQQRGLAHFVEHMIFEGTRRHSRQELERQMRARAGEFGAFTDEDATWIHLDLPTAEWQFGLNWLAENLFESMFPADRIAVERRILLREQEQRDNSVLWWRLAHAVFGDNSAVEGPADDKAARRNIQRRLSRGDLLRFYKRQYVPSNVGLTMVGDFGTEDARSRVRSIFGPIRRGRRPPAGARKPLTPSADAVRVASRGPFSRCAVWCGYAVPHCTMGEFDRLRELMWLVGTRTYDRVSAEEGLSYRVSYYPEHVRSQSGNDGQLFFLYAYCGCADTPRIERIMREEFARVRTERISEREIATMRAGATKGWREIANDNRSLAGTLMSCALSNGAPPDPQGAMQALNATELQQLASTSFRPERLVVAYYRPLQTPRELAATGALLVLVSIALVVSARRRNARLASAERAEESLSSRGSLRLRAARFTQGLLFGIPAAFVIWWPLYKLTDFLFSHAMFGGSFALSLAVVGVLWPALVAIAASAWGKRVAAGRDGILLITSGFHRLLRPGRIASITAGVVSMRRYALDPRYTVLGGDTGRWVMLRTKGGWTICLAVRDPEQFAQEARRYIEEGRDLPREITSPARDP